MVSAIITVLLIIATVVLDQVSKMLVVANMELYQSIDVIPGIFRFTYIHNYGAAFGSMAGSRWIFMILSTVAIIAILVYIFWKKPQDKLLLVSLGLIAGGGIGNMIDRVYLGYVVDFLDFCAFPKLWMWIFNVADACVCIGAGMLALWMILDTIKEEKEKKLAENNSAAEKVAENAESDEDAETTENSDDGESNA